MDIGHLAPEIALVVGAVTVVLTAVFASPGRQGATVTVALTAVVVAAGASVALASRAEQQISFEGTWALDGATSAAELIILAATALCLLLSVEWFSTDARRGELPAIVLFCAAGAMLLAGAADTMELVIGMLLVSVTGYTLAAFHRASAVSVEAGMKYFLVGALTNSVLLVGVVLLFGLTGTTDLGVAGQELAAGGDRVALVAVVVCLAVGLAFEIGAVPAHAWLPDVAQGAPAPMAAFLTVVPKVGAVVALGRVLHVLPDDVVGWRPLVAVLAATTMSVGNLLALWQDDLRRLLGWSSVSQAGYVLVGVVVLDRSDLALPGILVFLGAYAAANTAAFGIVTTLRGRTALADHRGLGATRPWAAAGLTIAMLSLVGVPPLGGFVGKLVLFTAGIDGGYGWLVAVAVANTVVSLFYYLRAIAPLWFEPWGPDDPAPLLGPVAGWSAATATVAVIAVGLAAGPLLTLLEEAQLLP